LLELGLGFGSFDEWKLGADLDLQTSSNLLKDSRRGESI
jgi:hypothetical protein